MGKGVAHTVAGFTKRSLHRLTVLFLALLSAVVLAQTPPPAIVQSSQTPLQLVVENRSGYEVDVLYKQNDEYAFHTSIPNGQDMVQQVTPGFVWFFGAGGETIIAQYQTNSAQQQRMVLTPEMIVSAGLAPAASPGSVAAEQQGSVLPAELPPPKFVKGPEVENDIPAKQDFSEDAAIEELEPIRAPLVEWYNISDKAFAILTSDTAFLTATESGGLTVFKQPRGTAADTKSGWMATEVEGKKGIYRINNLYMNDSYLYIDELAVQGSPVKLGTEGMTSPTGEWRIDKGQTFTFLVNVVRPNLKIGVRDGKVGLSSQPYNRSEYTDEIKAHQAGDAFALYSAEAYRALIGLVPALAQMAENVRILEEQEAKRQAAIEEKKRQAEAAERERRRIAAIPQVNRTRGHVTSRMGVGDVYDGENGEKAIKYKFNKTDSTEVLSVNLRTSKDPAKTQYLDLAIKPEVSAWVKDGDLYVAVKTDKQTTLSLRHGQTPSKDFPTDGNFYVGHVRANLRFDAGREVLWKPSVKNKEIGFGSSSDVSKGINVSAEEFIGADMSESSGTNVNFQSREFEVSGVRGPGPQMIGSLQYEWDSCALADKPKSTEPCTYEKPVDLYDSETLSLRKIPLIAHSLTGMETVTVFKNRFPREGLWSNVPIYLSIDVQLHAVKVVRSTKNNTKNKDWEDFKAGFTYVWRPDLWDTDKSFNDQHIIKEALQKPVGSTFNASFKVYMHANVDDLKPFMKSSL